MKDRRKYVSTFFEPVLKKSTAYFGNGTQWFLEFPNEEKVRIVTELTTKNGMYKPLVGYRVHFNSDNKIWRAKDKESLFDYFEKYYSDYLNLE